MNKPELLVTLKEVLELIEQTKTQPQFIQQTFTQADAIAQLGKLMWKDGQGKYTSISQMDEKELRCRLQYINKKVKALGEHESGTSWVGLTNRHWQKVFFYALERKMPVEEFGFYNHLQEQFFAVEAHNSPVVNTDKLFGSQYDVGHFEDVYTRLEDDNEWY